MWVPPMYIFWKVIRERLRQGAMVAEIGYNVELYIFLDNTFDSFRIFRFLGDTDFKICAPEIGACR